MCAASRSRLLMACARVAAFSSMSGVPPGVTGTKVFPCFFFGTLALLVEGPGDRFGHLATSAVVTVPRRTLGAQLLDHLVRDVARVGIHVQPVVALLAPVRVPVASDVDAERVDHDLGMATLETEVPAALVALRPAQLDHALAAVAHGDFSVHRRLHWEGSLLLSIVARRASRTGSCSARNSPLRAWYWTTSLIGDSGVPSPRLTTDSMTWTSRGMVRSPSVGRVGTPCGAASSPCRRCWPPRPATCRSGLRQCIHFPRTPARSCRLLLLPRLRELEVRRRKQVADLDGGPRRGKPALADVVAGIVVLAEHVEHEPRTRPRDVDPRAAGQVDQVLARVPDPCEQVAGDGLVPALRVGHDLHVARLRRRPAGHRLDLDLQVSHVDVEADLVAPVDGDRGLVAVQARADLAEHAGALVELGVLAVDLQALRQQRGAPDRLVAHPRLDVDVRVDGGHSSPSSFAALRRLSRSRSCLALPPRRPSSRMCSRLWKLPPLRPASTA